MLNRKTVKNILLEVEAVNYNYEQYLQDIIDEVFNNNNKDIKYLITRENNCNYLCMYSYSQTDFISWLYNNYDIDEVDGVKYLLINYDVRVDYIQQNYINYDIEDNILNFINVRKFRKALYKNKELLNIVKNHILTNIRNCENNRYLVKEYNLNKYLYTELLKIKKEAW